MKNKDVVIFNIKVKPNAKTEEVRLAGNILEAKVVASPVCGKANERLLELLSDYFDVPKSAIRILKGQTSRNKIIEIAGAKVSK